MTKQMQREIQDLAMRAGEEDNLLLEAALLLLLRASRGLSKYQKGTLIAVGQQLVEAFPGRKHKR
jgi:hypothetical protein